MLLSHLLPALDNVSIAAQQQGGDGGAGAIVSIIYLAVLVLVIAGLWKIYTKAGQPGWAAIIPIYNIIVLLRIVNRPLWWIILLLIPIANLIVLIIVYNDLAKAFGKGIGYTLGLIFLSFIFIPLLGFGDAQYTQPVRA